MDETEIRYTNLKQGRRGLSTVGTIFALVVVAAIGAVAYIQWGGTAAGSAPTVEDVMAAHESVESFEYNTNLSLETQLNPSELENRPDAQRLRQSLQYIPNAPEEGFPESLQAQLIVSGSVDLASSTVNQAQSDINLSVGTDQPEDVLDINFRRTGGQQYLRAQTLPEIGFFSLSQYEGQWYSASSTSQSQFGVANLSTQLPSGVPADAEISQETARELTRAMISEDVVVVEDRVRTELRSGAPAWQFQLGVNPDRADDYQQKAREIISENHPELATSSDLFITSSDTQDFQESLEQFDERVDKFNIWIDRNSDRVRRVVVEADLDSSELEEINQDESRFEGVDQATITFDVGLSAYNESINVEAPENSQPIESIFRGMMPTGSPQPGPNQPIQY